MAKKVYPIEISFLENDQEVIMLTEKKYNCRVTFYSKKNFKKISERRVNLFVIAYYKNNKLYKKMPYSKLIKTKTKLNLPPAQGRMFQQLELKL